MIDTTKKYWTGDGSEDINEYLRLYSGNDAIDVKPVNCRLCGNDTFSLKIDQDEDVIQVRCSKCGAEKILLDGQEVWEGARPRVRTCPVCKRCKTYNVRVGFLRRDNGNVRWVYIGNRCTNCGTLGSYLDWKVSYEPTAPMEQNL